MRKLNTKGFGIVEVLLLIVLVGAIGGAIYYVYNSQKKTNTALDNAANSQSDPRKSEKKNKESTDNDSQRMGNKYFELKLPPNWQAGKENSFTVGNPEASYSYTDNAGSEFTIIVNAGGFGGGGDAQAEYNIVNNTPKLTRDLVFCDPNADISGGCKYGNSKLELLYSSNDSIGSNNYLIQVINSNGESTQYLNSIADIIETAKFK